ncbi:substrate-binding domain-containing protein [Salinispira pacifica]|uniref:histidine kinase n=1 Tax=Salinispira pacifica TaxID=1307761 RepID=V5WKK4_9SPIO|nr:substrate-binding domain-containing protein [Salinispira pacifica]AHC16283.1 hypothetical protein L21SP2_2937 [Salinispira pacifica]
MKTVDPVLLLQPGYSFFVSWELAAGIGEVFDAHGIPWISVNGGYLLEENYPVENVGEESIDGCGDKDSELPPDPGGGESGNWIYQLSSRVPASGFIIYGGGLAYREQEGLLRSKIINPLSGRPVVNVGSELEDLPCINADNYRGMYDLVCGLVTTGTFKNPAFLAGPPGNIEAEERYRAFLDALQHASMKFDPEYYIQGDFTSFTARSRIHDFLHSGKELPDLIVCANDLSAFGASQALSEHSISIPEDVMLSGFDDFEYASAMNPPLSTVQFPIREMGKKAAETMLALINEQESGAGNTEEHPNSKEKPEALDSRIASVPVFRPSTGHALKGTQVNRARELLLGDLRIKERQQFRLKFTKILLEQPRLSRCFPELADTLMYAGVRVLLVMLQNEESGDEQLLRMDQGFYVDTSCGERRVVLLTPDTRKIRRGERLLPPDLSEIICTPAHRIHTVPLQHNSTPLGYIVAAVTPDALDLPEHIAYELSGYLYRWTLIHQASQREREREALLDELQHAQRELSRVERLTEMSRLIAGVGHELNTPIGSSITLASFLQDRSREILGSFEHEISADADQESVRRSSENPGEAYGIGEVIKFLHQVGEASDSLQRNLRRAGDLVDTFRSLSVQPGQQKLSRFRPRDVFDILYSRSTSTRGANLDMRIDCPEQLEVYNDAEALEQVFQELIHNSIQHGYESAQKGEIGIQAAVRGEQLTIRYEDGGAGVSQGNVNRIFEPFFTTKRGKGLVGMGLHLVHNLVQYHLKGVISVNRRQGGGLLFLISVPVEHPGT